MLPPSNIFMTSEQSEETRELMSYKKQDNGKIMTHVCTLFRLTFFCGHLKQIFS